MLDLYKNIKSRRIELKMTQEELARKTGYTNKSSIATIEAGKIDLPQSKILEFARALDIDAPELMGWDDPCGSPAPDVKPEYIEIIDKYSRLNPSQQRVIVDTINAFLDGNK